MRQGIKLIPLNGIPEFYKREHRVKICRGTIFQLRNKELIRFVYAVVLRFVQRFHIVEKLLRKAFLA